MQYLIIALVAIILLVIFLKKKPYKDENRIRNEEMIEALNANIAQFTDKTLEDSIILDYIPSALAEIRLSDVDKRRIALALKGKVLSSDASYIGSSYRLKHSKDQYKCLRWVEQTLNEHGVHGEYRISDSVNANDIGVALDTEVLKGLHTLHWYFD